MKTAAQLLEEYTEEYQRLTASGQVYYRVSGLKTLLYITKHLNRQEQGQICNELIKLLSAWIIKQKAELAQTHASLQLEDLEPLYNRYYPFKHLFQSCVPFAVSEMSEEELLDIFEIFIKNEEVQLYHTPSGSWNAFALNNFVLGKDVILELINYYLQEREPTESFLAGVDKVQASFPMGKKDTYWDLIERVLAGSPDALRIYYPLPENPTIEIKASNIGKGKKWQEIREHPLGFTHDREDFYQLIADISKVNFFNLPEASSLLEKARTIIDNQAYEAFILDIYSNIMKSGKKRAGWFVGEKVAVLQIFLWLTFALETPNRFDILVKYIEKAFTKIPRVGPTSRKIGDLALRILEESESIKGLGALLGLKAKAKYPVFKEALEKSVNNAINYTQLNPNDVEDYFISDYGLKEGSLTKEFGKYASEIRVESYSKVQISWFKPDGSPQKSVPAKVKNEHDVELTLWKARAKDIKKALSSQKYRFEAFWRYKKSWNFKDWVHYLLNHKLLEIISKKLIWQFELAGNKRNGIFQHGRLVDVQGDELRGLEESKVSLWHPCEATVAEVQAWRAYMFRHQIKQPFKQAFREIYLLTEAELETDTFSNRFTRHIVRHQKLAALARQRHWTYNGIYSYDYPYLEYKDFGLKVIFDLSSEGDLAVTGKVSFQEINSNKEIRLLEVPEIIFSESMRDADLYVGVCSIGLEDEWDQGAHYSYWSSYSKADLSETAKTRKNILENMIPKLKIGDQCEITDKYLIVKGKIRTYKIHLGSGNILMEPNDQYLCIIPDRSSKNRASQVFLPFDDDATFSVILSKAILLADDDEITDQVILNQIHV
ncbi:MAG: DUF4132 domain-containing protein [Bacteroidia bacterium]|nr:DUF4132 domain-containing protein [Bacteroidia bacterium]